MYREWKPIYEAELSTSLPAEKMIRQPTTGLLGTNFDWNDVQKVIDETYHGDLKLGDGRKIQPFAEGVGLQSLLGVIHGDWSSSKIPDTIVLKIGSPLAMIKALEQQASHVPPELALQIVQDFVDFLPPCHNSEVFFYEQFRKLGNTSEIPEIPEYFFGNRIEKLGDGNYTKGCIGMEYIENVQTLSPAQNFNDAQIKQVLKILAKLEAKFLDVPESEYSATPHDGLTGLYITFKDWFLELNNKILGSIPHPKMAELSAKFTKKLPEIISANQIDEIAGRIGIKKVLVHGDLWSANLLWNGEKLEKILDFQMIHFGLAATDLTRFFNTCLSVEDRKSNWKLYLQFFYDELISALAEHKKDAPYTFDQLLTTYQLVYPRTSAYLLPPLTAVLEKISKLPEGELKMVALGTIISKIVSIYEEIFERHEQKPSY